MTAPHRPTKSAKTGWKIDWKTTRQLGVAMAVISALHLMQLYARHGMEDVPTAEPVSLSGALQLQPRTIKGFVYYGIALATPTKVVPLYCGEEPAQDCFPGVQHYDGKEVEVRVQGMVAGAPRVTKIALPANGKVLADQSDFAERRTLVVNVYKNNSLWFAICGVVLAAFATIKLHLQRQHPSEN